MSRRLKRFMVGYDQDWQVVYGRNDRRLNAVDTGVRYAHAMTALQAQRKLKELVSPVAKTIYKLVPVSAKEIRDLLARKGRAR